MNQIEYIKVQIIKKRQEIDYYNNLNKNNSNTYLSEKDKHLINLLEKELQHLQQIKNILEAWEVVQGTIVEGQDRDGHYCYIETVYFTGEKGEKVTKGLYNDETR